MEKILSKSELDRRGVLLFGAAAVFGGMTFAMSDDVKAEEIAPGVTLKMLKEVVPIGPIPGFSKARLIEITWQPGSKFGPDTSKTVALCEIQGAPLYVEMDGMEPFTLQPGDMYACPVGRTETNTNKSDKPSVMRIMELEPTA